MFVNHSCAPNCETEEDKGRVYIKAIRNIAAGEELVYEYNLHDSDDESADCYCGAPQCRHTMFSDDELKRRARIAKRKAAERSAAMIETVTRLRSRIPRRHCGRGDPPASEICRALGSFRPLHCILSSVFFSIR